MLTHFKIENFKAWREADLTLGKMTGFFGSNSAGKSSLLQFLLALKQTRSTISGRCSGRRGGRPERDR